uniref:ATP synthase F0 subunit 8 n=1 Tax=Smittia aterrima TaxID=611654 RepID=UPI0022DCE294|nr:ATP synthase F0 subunit 8 [Smittia aterrima]WAB46356.1 ATP synthase F0 subunit 8 [Smittia aterrima]
MSWLILFFIFSTSFIMFNIMNYFCFFSTLNMNKPFDNKNNQSMDNKNSKTNWKW